MWVAWMRGGIECVCGVSPLCGVDTGSAVWFRLSRWSLSSSEIRSLGLFIDSVCSSSNEPEPHSPREKWEAVLLPRQLEGVWGGKVIQKSSRERPEHLRPTEQDSTLHDTEGWKVGECLEVEKLFLLSQMQRLPFFSSPVSK